VTTLKYSVCCGLTCWGQLAQPKQQLEAVRSLLRPASDTAATAATAATAVIASGQ
jgi:hypothetical protein